jgi:hypothetical protein
LCGQKQTKVLFVVETTTYIDIVSQTEKTMADRKKQGREKKLGSKGPGRRYLLWVQKEDSEPLMTTEAEVRLDFPPNTTAFDGHLKVTKKLC